MGSNQIAAAVDKQWQQLRRWLPMSVPTGIAEDFPNQLVVSAHGKFAAWLEKIDALNLPIITRRYYQQSVVTAEADDYVVQEPIAQVLRMLIPWRKGPFSLCGIDIDSEWRSDFKYQRLCDTGIDFSQQDVLDVGTGNGYFLYRYLGDNARFILGIDPSWHVFAQFLLLQKFFQADNIALLPTTLEILPLQQFSITLAMGVLYHRRDVLRFLAELRDTLKPQGSLVIETLVLADKKATVYTLDGHYLGMHNVWCLPSVAQLCVWLTTMGFTIEYASEPTLITTAEQRRTAWMQTYSLQEFLAVAPKDEPPPLRAIVVACKKR